MTGMFTLAQWEWFRFRRRVSALVLLALVAFIVLAALGVAAAFNEGWVDFFGEVGYFPVAAGAVGAVAPFLAIVLAAFIYAMDLQGGACRTLAARGASRLVILGSKALACVVLLVALHIFALGAATLFALVSTPHFLEWRDGLESMGASLLNSFLYLSLGIALAHWRQSVAFTVGIGIGLIFFEAVFYPLAEGLGQIQDWPIREFTAWTLRGVTLGLQGESHLFGAAWYIPIVAAYSCGLACLAALAFNKFDLKAGGD